MEPEEIMLTQSEAEQGAKSIFLKFFQQLSGGYLELDPAARREYYPFMNIVLLSSSKFLKARWVIGKGEVSIIPAPEGKE